MNKEAFEVGLANLQAQLDAAERILNEANAALNEAERAYGEARRALRGHLSYGKARGWIEREKRTTTAPRLVLDALGRGPATAEMLMERTGLSKPSVMNAISGLRGGGHEIARNDGYYSLQVVPAAPEQQAAE